MKNQRHDPSVTIRSGDPMGLPSLSALSLTQTPRSIADEWRAACGTRPTFKSWARLKGKHKRRLLHQVAIDCDDDTGPNGRYITAYERKGIDDVMQQRVWSVEHVLPRSKVNGHAPGDAENDPLGWTEATRNANSRRSNHPLVLWLFDNGSLPVSDFVTIEGVRHFVPPQDQRARLARKWAFTRATYPDEVAPPSAAQLKNAANICAMIKHTTPFKFEICVNNHFRKKYNWANPLLEMDAGDWLDNIAFRNLVFGI